MTLSVSDRETPSALGLTRAAQGLAVDRQTCEVLTAFAAMGVRPILLKGPSIARWLYPEGGRGYGDTDLLVPPLQFAPAVRVLGELGFVAALKGFSPFELGPDPGGTAFIRHPESGCGPGGWVDLHRHLHGVAVSDDVLWETLHADAETMQIGGVEVQVLSRTGVGLHIVMHAVQHRFGLHTGEDLRRAVSTLSVDGWSEVAVLAATLGAGDVLGFGLRHDPVGAAVADHLGLPTLSIDLDAPRGGCSVSRWWAQTWTEKLEGIRWTLFPSRAKVSYLSQLREPSPWMLARAYAQVWCELATIVVPAVRWAVTQRKARVEPVP